MNLQSQFDFDYAEEGTDGTVAFHNWINIQFFIGFESIIQFFEYFVFDNLKLDFFQLFKSKLFN